MKIAVVTARFSITGVPLAQIRLARALAGRGHAVELIFGRGDPDHPIPKIPNVKVTVWKAPNVRAIIRPMRSYLADERPDIVFSAEDHLNGAVLAAAILSGSKAKISGSSRVPPSFTYSNRPFTKGWLFKQLLRAVMWRADALTCVSQDMVDQYRGYFANAPHVCVHNIVVDQASRERMTEPVEHPWFNDRTTPLISAAGTLSPRKGFIDLIDSVKLLADHGRDCRLVIFGEGRARPDLEERIAAHGLEDRISLPGRIANPLRYFARSDVFVLSSYAEGLPNVLVEAMLCGCTPVATDCPTGPREVLQDDRYGYLVPMHAPAAMADAIARVLDAPIPVETLDQGIAPFTEEAVIGRHFDMLGIA